MVGNPEFVKKSSLSSTHVLITLTGLSMTYAVKIKSKKGGSLLWVIDSN